jgi:hypothetical protein
LKEESNFKIQIPSSMSYIPSFNLFIEREKQFQNPNSRTTELHPFSNPIIKEKINFKIQIPSPMSYLPSSNPITEGRKQFQKQNSISITYLPSSNLFIE